RIWSSSGHFDRRHRTSKKEKKTGRGFARGLGKKKGRRGGIGEMGLVRSPAVGRRKWRRKEGMGGFRFCRREEGAKGRDVMVQWCGAVLVAGKRRKKMNQRQRGGVCGKVNGCQSSDGEKEGDE
ncbi:hypothetical protein HAX54_016653, partial [Datura stramonium]|nr:hypothetical protein [Datura stramonium]